MKNYLCVNGEKFDLTDKQVECIKKMITPKCLLGDVGVGETFRLGEHEFILCEHLEDGKAVVLLKDLLFEKNQFGSNNNNNNYDGSNVDEICNKFAGEMEGLVGGALCEFSLDLTADDGLKCYGSIERKAALLTANMCRKYVETLDKYKIDKWWWTSTAYSTPKHDDSSWIKCVSPLGLIDGSSFSCSIGVRPYWWNVRQSRHKPKSIRHTKRTRNLSERINKKKWCCMTDFEKVIDFGNMYKAFRKSKSGKGYKNSAAKFNSMALEGVNALIKQLKDRTYKVSDYTEFKVYEPKERVIKTTSFKDKVVQHCLCDNVILPRLQDVFIHDNCAGQKGKGTLFGLDRLSEQMRDFYKRYGFDGYILKCDITKFFYNISHEQLKNIVEYYFNYDDGICWLCDLFIDSTDGKGIPLGNQINQGFALLYLDGMDKLITGELGIQYYGRYMDDFYLIHPSKEYLKYCLEVITEFLKTLDLTMNGKTQIFPFKNGVSYLGFHTYIVNGGKVIRKVKNQNKRNAQKKYLRMAKLVASDKLSREKFDDSYQAYKNHISHGNCYKLGKSLDEKINNVLGG